MGFTVPITKNYGSPLNAVPLDWMGPPVEGNRGIQCTIPWTTAFAGVTKAVSLNLADNAPLAFSKIRALVFDNSDNGSDVQVIFPDTQTTMTVPAYTPYAVIPCFTNQTQFIVSSENALSTDETRFMILNTLPPPMTVPITELQNFSVNSGLNNTVDNTVQIIAAGINGTIESINLVGWLNGGVANGTITFFLQDGDGHNIWEGTYIVTLDSTVNWDASLAGIRVRFSNGLKLGWTVANPIDSGYVCPNIYYRLP